MRNDFNSLDYKSQHPNMSLRATTCPERSEGTGAKQSRILSQIEGLLRRPVKSGLLAMTFSEASISERARVV